MGKFKVRRPLLANGGLVVNSSASLNSGGAIGSGGTEITTLMFGSVAACVLQLTASGPLVAGSMLIPGLPANSKIFLTGYDACGIMVATAKVSAASSVSASFGRLDHAATGGVLVASFHYMAIV